MSSAVHPERGSFLTRRADRSRWPQLKHTWVSVNTLFYSSYVLQDLEKVCAKRIKVWLLILEVIETWSITFKADLRISARSIKRKKYFECQASFATFCRHKKEAFSVHGPAFPAHWLCMKVCKWANVNWRSWLQKRSSRSRGIKPATRPIIGLPALPHELQPPLELQMLTNATWYLFTFVNEASLELDNQYTVLSALTASVSTFEF